MSQQATPAEPRAVLYHGAAAPLAAAHAAFEAEGVARYALSDWTELPPEFPDLPTVLVLDAALAAAPELHQILERLPETVSLVAADDAVDAQVARTGRVLLALPDNADLDRLLRTLRLAFQHSAARLVAENARRELERTRNELHELSRTGMALMTERDPERLLVEILNRAQRLTNSDAGSLYLVEQAGTERRLRFAVARNDSIPDLPIARHVLALDPSSLAGYVATTGETLVLEDAYLLPETVPYSFNRSFDERFGYRTRSVLVVPMLDHRDEIVGVLQLLNRKREGAGPITDDAAADRYVLSYGEREVRLVRSLAGQAAVSIENSSLYREIERIFESFVKAAVSAIDQRDPSTAGHSVRVASLTCDMAAILAEHGRGRLAGRRFSREQMRELRYAALLHDFGKVGVREEVLVKAKKLPPFLEERVSARFDLIRRTLEAEYHRRRAERLERYGPSGLDHALEEEFRRELAELDRLQAAVRAANEPSILPEKSARVLDEIARRTFRGLRGEQIPYLTEEELHFLAIPKGSLDDHERREIESHVEQTYRFLAQIPWTDDLRNVAEIAYGHHEKLDGRGYPRGIRGDQIPVQTRLMTIADIFDALTAADRPYKRAVSTDDALDILVAEAKEGMLDMELVEMLIESKIYERIVNTDWRTL
ncbi:MAG TPA: HD domain-containing phosphohydrolase [Longimicrobiales bacterium]